MANDPRAAQSVERISTGVPELDEMFAGGLLPRRPYLLVGPPGSGKTTLALQFLIEGVRRGEEVLYVTLEEPPNEVRMDHQGMGPELDQIYVFDAVPDVMRYERVPFKDIASARQAVRFGQVPLTIRQTPEFESVDVTMTALQPTIRQEVRRRHFKRLVIDSLTALQFFCMPGVDLTQGAQTFLRFLSDLGTTTILTLEAPSAEEESEEHLLARGELRLFRWEAEGKSQYAIGVEKFRGSAHDIHLHPYRISPRGLDINLSVTIPSGGVALPVQPEAREILGVPPEEVAYEIRRSVLNLDQDIRDLLDVGIDVKPMHEGVRSVLTSLADHRYDEALLRLRQTRALADQMIDAYHVSGPSDRPKPPVVVPVAGPVPPLPELAEAQEGTDESAPTPVAIPEMLPETVVSVTVQAPVEAPSSVEPIPVAPEPPSVTAPSAPPIEIPRAPPPPPPPPPPSIVPQTLPVVPAEPPAVEPVAPAAPLPPPPPPPPPLTVVVSGTVPAGPAPPPPPPPPPPSAVLPEQPKAIPLESLGPEVVTEPARVSPPPVVPAPPSPQATAPSEPTSPTLVHRFFRRTPKPSPPMSHPSTHVKRVGGPTQAGPATPAAPINVPPVSPPAASTTGTARVRVSEPVPPLRPPPAPSAFPGPDRSRTSAELSPQAPPAAPVAPSTAPSPSQPPAVPAVPPPPAPTPVPVPATIPPGVVAEPVGPEPPTSLPLEASVPKTPRPRRRGAPTSGRKRRTKPSEPIPSSSAPLALDANVIVTPPPEPESPVVTAPAAPPRRAPRRKRKAPPVTGADPGRMLSERSGSDSPSPATEETNKATPAPAAEPPQGG